MVSMVIIHEQTRDYIYPVTRSKLAIRLKTRKKAADSCHLLYWNRFKKDTTGELVAKMRCYARDEFFDYYEIIIDTIESTKYIKYYFQLSKTGQSIYFNYHGATILNPTDGFFEYLYTNEKDIFEAPLWSKGTVFYQIFPERFCNGDLTNDPKNTVPWGSTPTRDNYLGGDLQGIINKLDYLENLGVEALYLTPIFKASSNHKYDTVDYFQIDPSFGTSDDLKKLVQICHRKGMKIILDGVFNHCGYFFPPFQDLLKNGVDSKYKDWFLCEGLPLDPENVNYETTGYYKWMPKLRLSNPQVRAFILKIASFWMTEANIDGWRLDVADEVDYTFWQDFRKVVKSINPQCFILAETWRENREMLRGDQMDSVMNYLFRDALVDFFAKKRITPSQFDERINRILGVYPTTTHLSLYNLIGSHDTARFLTLSKEEHRILKTTSAFQLCFPGIAGIYYGDEIGLTGENDPDCRKCMDWVPPKEKLEISNWYKKLIALRKRMKPLRLGSFASNYCSTDNYVYGFYREFEEDRVYVVINNSDLVTEITYPVLESPTDYYFLTDLLSGESHLVENSGNNLYHNSDLHSYQGALRLKLQPYQVKIIYGN
ncbi:MAG TPA: alpha-glycosidase [Firmicutes bacterium]|nr:alpha-glycosidase [Bacillota bacterium]